MYGKGFYGSKDKLSFLYRFPSKINLNGCKNLLGKIHKDFSLIYKTEEHHILEKGDVERVEYSIGGALRLDEERVVNFDFEKRVLGEDFSSVEFFAPEDPQLEFYDQNVETFNKLGKTIDHFFENLGIELSDK